MTRAEAVGSWGIRLLAHGSIAQPPPCGSGRELNPEMRGGDINMRESMTAGHNDFRRYVSGLICATTAAVTFTTAAVSQSGASPRPSAAEASLRKAEDQLFEADVERDVAAIARGFAAEAIFVHANGMTQTKAEYMRATASGAIPIRSINTQDRIVRIFGDLGVIRGVKNLVVGDMHLSGSYLAVYVKRDGHWQMLDSQSTPLFKPAKSR
jgi:Domain of unknown function (DUF4440)